MGWRRIVIVLLIAVEGLLLATFLPLPNALVRRQGHKLAKMSPTAAVAQVESMRKIHPELLPAVVGLLKEADRETAVKLRHRLMVEIDRWQRLPAKEAQKRLNRLAQTLDEQVEQLSPQGKRQAIQIAEVILNSPLPPSPTAVEMFAHCNNVLQRTRHFWLSGSRVAQAPQASRYNAVVSPEEMALGTPGGGIPLQPTELSSDARSLPLADDPSPHGAPRLLEPPATARPPQPKTLPYAPARPIRPDDQEDRNRREGGEPAILPEVTEELGFAPDAPTIQLIQALRSNHRGVHRAARALLTKRGFGNVHFKVAMRLFDPNPAVRRKLAEELPSLHGIEPQPWLLLLARDVDANIRLLAVSILATSGRKSTYEEFQRIEKTETDARVLHQIRKALARPVVRDQL